jgi:hypothetical protein
VSTDTDQQHGWRPGEGIASRWKGYQRDYHRKLWPEAPTDEERAYGATVTRSAIKKLHKRGIKAHYQGVYSLYVDMVEDGDFSGVETPPERTSLLVDAWIAEET